MKIYLPDNRSLEVDWFGEGYVGWFLCNMKTEDLSSVSPRSIHGPEWTSDGPSSLESSVRYP